MSPLKPVASILLLSLTLLGLLFLPPSPHSETEDWSLAFRGHGAFLDSRIQPLTLLGSSMTPSLSENDLLLCVKCDPSGLRIGEIIVYNHEGTLVAHRIVEIPETGVVITQGDSPQAWERHTVRWENILWKVMGVFFR